MKKYLSFKELFVGLVLIERISSMLGLVYNYKEGVADNLYTSLLQSFIVLLIGILALWPNRKVQIGLGIYYFLGLLLALPSLSDVSKLHLGILLAIAYLLPYKGKEIAVDPKPISIKNPYFIGLLIFGIVIFNYKLFL